MSDDSDAELVARLAASMSAVIGRRIGPDENFFEAGLDSATLVRAYREATVEEIAPFPVTELFARPNLRSLGRHLAGAPVPGPGSGRHADGRGADLRRRALARRRARTRPEGET